MGNQSSTPQSILLIGASGFLGSKLYSELSKHAVVTGTYFSRPASDLVPLDTSDRMQVSALLSRIRPDVIIDCSGQTRPDSCERNQQIAYRVNVEGVANLVELCNTKYVYFSTDYVFDGVHGHYTEDDQPHPINYYGWTKFQAEKIVLGARTDNVVIRVSGVYGISPRNNEFLSSLNEPVINKATDCFSSNVLLDDIAENLAFFWARGGIYHLTDGEALSRYEFTFKAVRILGMTAKVVGKQANVLYRIAQRPRDSSLLSIRHTLPIQNAENGLQCVRTGMQQNDD